MRLANLPISIIMQSRPSGHRWAEVTWSAIDVVVDDGAIPILQILRQDPGGDIYVVSGLQLEFFADEQEGYLENCNAPAPKVFILWRMEGGRAMPLKASVSYAEGTRMFDSGEMADGVKMAGDIHAWLADNLRQHYQPRERHGHGGAHRRGQHV
jgi:hypothetical protein